MMTPLMMEILLHYYYSPEEYRDGDLSAPAVHDSIQWACCEGLLEPIMKNQYGATFKSTDRCRALVNAWCDMPLPVQVWVIPEDGSK
jgi:hypothetical protein